jgi:hypothetical protein
VCFDFTFSSFPLLLSAVFDEGNLSHPHIETLLLSFPFPRSDGDENDRGVGAEVSVLQTDGRSDTGVD